MIGYGYLLPPRDNNQDFIQNNSVPVTDPKLLKQSDWVYMLMFDDGWYFGELMKGDDGALGYKATSGWCSIDAAAELRFSPADYSHTTDIDLPNNPHVMIRVTVKDGNGRVESNLHHMFVDDEGDTPLEESAMMDTLESLILAQACEGIDVSSGAYARALETVLDALSNN